MKRYSFLLVLLPSLLGWAGLATNASAQGTAAEAAAREAAEDNNKRLSARVEELVANQALQQQQIAALEKGFAELRQKIEQANNNAATQESLSRLAEQIQKVDQARVSENRRIQETLDELHRILNKAATSPPPSRTNPAPTPVPSRSNADSEEYFEHTVEKGDTLSGIVQAYRKKKIMVTQELVKEANPKVKNWDWLRERQKILIPKPKS